MQNNWQGPPNDVSSVLEVIKNPENIYICEPS